MPTVLEQLRAAQRDAGLVAPTHPEQDLIIQGTDVAFLNPLVPAPARPFSEPAVYIREQGLPGGGYIKIFPPTMQSIRDLTPEWIEANWTKPSPWCRMEGQSDHPEFEGNLAGVER